MLCMNIGEFKNGVSFTCTLEEGHDSSHEYRNARGFKHAEWTRGAEVTTVPEKPAPSPMGEWAEEIKDLVRRSKSTAEFFVHPRHNDMMNDLATGTLWITGFQLFDHGYNQLVIQARVVNRDLIEFEIRAPDGERLGLINMRRDARPE